MAGQAILTKSLQSAEKSLCGIFRTDTLALVTPKDRNSRCEQLVNSRERFFVLRLTFPDGLGAQRPRRSANRTTACAVVIINHFYRSTEGFYAPTSLPKLVSPEHALPTAPL